MLKNGNKFKDMYIDVHEDKFESDIDDDERQKIEKLEKLIEIAPKIVGN